MNESFNINMLKRSGHTARIRYGKLATMSRRSKSGRKGRRGKSHLRWEDCVKRDIERVENELRTRAKDRKHWRQLLENKDI